MKKTKSKPSFGTNERNEEKQAILNGRDRSDEGSSDRNRDETTPKPDSESWFRGHQQCEARNRDRCGCQGSSQRREGRNFRAVVAIKANTPIIKHWRIPDAAKTR
jgi:hypothetical protein